MTAEQSSSCIFCEIAGGRIQAHTVFESDRFLAFLDVRPIRRGHVQIIPREHYRYFDDLPPDLASGIMLLGGRIASALKRVYKVERVAFLFTGGDIAHAHAHVVPMLEATDITSRRYIREKDLTFGPTPLADAGELAMTADELRNAL